MRLMCEDMHGFQHIDDTSKAKHTKSNLKYTKFYLKVCISFQIQIY